MTGFRVRNERLPSRCEICHQADLFDPETGECTRCMGISVSAVAKTAVSAKVGRGILHRFRLLRLKTFSLLLVLAGSISMYLFVESIFWTPRTVPTFKPNRFEPPIVANDPVPVINNRNGEVELSGMLSEAEKQSGECVEGVTGKIVGDGVHGSIGNLFGWSFRVQLGKGGITCFCPRISKNDNIWIPVQLEKGFEMGNPFIEGNYVYLAGRYDPSLDVIFVSRIIIRGTPFRGDELPQS